MSYSYYYYRVIVVYSIVNRDTFTVTGHPCPLTNIVLQLYVLFVELQ